MMMMIMIIWMMKRKKRLPTMKKLMVSLMPTPDRLAPVMDHDDILIEVVHVVPGDDDNVTLHNQPPTMR